MTHPAVARALLEGRQKLLEHEALELVKSYGIPVAEFGLARSAEEAVRIADSIGYPVVAKVVSPNIVHKTDVGGVVVNISDSEGVVRAYERLRDVSRRVPYAEVVGILIQRMVPRGVELLVGGLRDPVFGHVVACGLGGIFTELFRDVSVRLAPLDEEDAWSMVEDIRAYHMLMGYRGLPRRDIAAVVDVLVKFSRLLADNVEIAEADLNPVIVLEEGKGAYVVDARFMISPG